MSQRQSESCMMNSVKEKCPHRPDRSSTTSLKARSIVISVESLNYSLRCVDLICHSYVTRTSFKPY